MKEALRCYDLAQRSSKEKRVAHNEMKRQCEVIRDFWRNKLVEHSTRGGRMVVEAIRSKKSNNPL